MDMHEYLPFPRISIAKLRLFTNWEFPTQEYSSIKNRGRILKERAYKKMKKSLSAGDVIFIKSIDRLGRNYSMILEEWRYLTKMKNVDIVVLDMPLLDTRGKNAGLVPTFIADLVLQVLSFVAENERINIKQRQAEGIHLAKMRGVKFGRPRLSNPENLSTVITLYRLKKITSREACNMCGLSRGTFFRRLRSMQ